MRVVTTKAELRDALRRHRDESIGLVPTMGYLHEGHLSLMRAARRETDFVVATIFVNPTQFGPGEDLDRYPRDEAGDRASCEEIGVDLLWMPPIADVYAPDHTTTVTVAEVTDGLCGTSRPGHFAGVATIVTKLFNLVRPHRAYFGQKDYQQLAMIRRLARDLDMPVTVVGLPIVREPDGLAMSSRNAYLEADERRDARQLSRAIAAVDRAWRSGQRDASSLRTLLRETLSAAPLVRVDYAEIVDPDDLAPLTGTVPDGRPPVALVAAFLGSTRLIDNRLLGADPQPDGGRRTTAAPRGARALPDEIG